MFFLINLQQLKGEVKRLSVLGSKLSVLGRFDKVNGKILQKYFEYLFPNF